MESLKTFVTTELPYSIVKHYQLMEEASAWQDKVNYLFRFFEIGIRKLALALVGQYLIGDRGLVNDPEINLFLEEALSKATLGVWECALFGVVRAYAGHRDIFFFPELYDQYWDTSHGKPQPKTALLEPFDRLISLHADLRAGRGPTQEQEWQALFEQAYTHLEAVVEGLSFLQHYELIKITSEQAGRYTYERHVGTEIRPSDQPLETAERLQVHRFYMIDERSHRILKLYPLVTLLVEMTADISAAPLATSIEPGLYHHYDGETVYYMLPSAAEWRGLPEMTGEFVASVVWALRKRLEEDSQRQAAEKSKDWERLTWESWREIVHEMSLRLSGHIQQKYSPDIYLQRQQAFGHVERFLQSNQACLLITGKSGVGKSNLIASLLEYWWTHEPDIALLLYDGARLSAQKPFEQQINEDIRRQLDMLGIERDWKWQDLRDVPSMRHKRFVIALDALNENQQAREILWQVDQFVGQVTQPWLKVILSSRPEAWQAMKRRQHLAEHQYYRPTTQDEIGIKLESFDDRSRQDEYELRLTPFAGRELKQAYELYRRRFDLKTAYDDLSGEVRQLLRDPLMLRLTAQMYRGTTIPERLRVSQLYQEYVGNLAQRGALEASDVFFLEEELVPLMISDGHYSNVITAEQINHGRTQNNLRLYELVYDETCLSDGRPFNAVFRRLADAEILARQGTGFKQEIGFKYERFYDDYAGRRLHGIVNGKADPETQYRELARLFREKPYLWGPVRVALQAEVQNGNDALILRLAQTDETVVKEMTVAALIEFGSEQPERTQRLLLALLATQQKGLKRGKEPDVPVRMARQAAVEAASALGMEQILTRAARDESPSIRALAAQHTYYLWQRDKEKGYRVLEDLASGLRGIRTLLRLDEMETWLGIAMMIAFEHSGEPGLERLAQLAHAQADSILFLRQGGLVGKAIRAIEERSISLLVRLLKRQIDYVEEANIVFLNMPELANFFSLSQARREQFHRMIPYINPELDIEPVWEELKELAREPDVMCNYLVDAVIWGRAIVNPRRMQAKWFELLDVSLAAKPYPPPTIMIAFSVLGDEACAQEALDDELIENYLDYLDRYEKSSAHVCATRARKYRWTQWGAYVHMHYAHYGSTDVPPLQHYIDRAQENRDWEALRLCAHEIAYEVAYNAQTKPLVWALRPLVRIGEPSVREALIRALAWIRVYNPSSVEDFLEEMGFTPEEQRKVRNLSVETVGQTLDRTSLVFVREVLLNPSDDTVRKQVMWWFEQARECDNVYTWLALFVKMVINLVYGQQVFQTTQPPVR